MFRVEGMRVSFDVGCNLVSAGNGAGTLHLENEDRAYAVSLNAMGTVAVTRSDEATGTRK